MYCIRTEERCIVAHMCFHHYLWYHYYDTYYDERRLSLFTHEQITLPLLTSTASQSALLETVHVPSFAQCVLGVGLRHTPSLDLASIHAHIHMSMLGFHRGNFITLFDMAVRVRPDAEARKGSPLHMVATRVHMTMNREVERAGGGVRFRPHVECERHRNHCEHEEHLK